MNEKHNEKMKNEESVSLFLVLCHLSERQERAKKNRKSTFLMITVNEKRTHRSLRSYRPLLITNLTHPSYRTTHRQSR